MSTTEQWLEAAPPTQLTASATISATTIDKQVAPYVAKANGVSIASDADYVTAVDYINELKAEHSRLDKERIKTKKPFLDGCNELDAMYRGPLALLDSSVKVVKATMVKYDERKRLEREAEERRLIAERRKATLEAERLEREAQARLRAEEDARRETQRLADAEARRKVEAAEAEARREREARESAEAKARGDQQAAAASEARAKQAEEDARKAKEQGRLDREAAIEARRKQLKAEAATQAAVENMSAGNKAASMATAAALEAPKELETVSGVSRKRVWKYRLKAPIEQVPMMYHTVDHEVVQAAVDRLKDMAQATLGDWLEVYFKDDLAVGKKR